MKRSEFLKQTRQHLVTRRSALRTALAGDTAALRGGEHEGSVGDEIDAAIATEHAEMRSQMASFESRELAQIENALAKIRAGTYGRCEVCEQPIAPLRLKALPYATECIACARREERRGAVPARGGVNRIAAYDLEESVRDESLEEIS